MKFVQKKGTTAKSKYTVENFVEVKKAFLQDVVSVVAMEEVPAGLILIGTRLVLSLCHLHPGQWIKRSCHIKFGPGAKVVRPN